MRFRRKKVWQDRLQVQPDFIVVVLPVCSVGDGEDVRGNFVAFLALVDLDDLLRVDGQADVGIDDNAKEAGVSLK